MVGPLVGIGVGSVGIGLGSVGIGVDRARFVVDERTLEPAAPSGLAHDVPNEWETADQPGHWPY